MFERDALDWRAARGFTVIASTFHSADGQSPAPGKPNRGPRKGSAQRFLPNMPIIDLVSYIGEEIDLRHAACLSLFFNLILSTTVLSQDA